MTTTTNMGLTQSTVGTTTGPDWATNAENNLLTIDAHDHTSGKGVQLTPSSLNINADLEFNLNSATELKNVVLDNAVHASASGDTNNSVYEYDGNLYWRNASGGSVQITSGTAVNTSGGSISGMTGNAQVLFSSNSYAFKFDSSLSDPGIAKISHADIDLYKYDAAGSAAKVTLKFLGTGTSAALTVPDETGTLLTTATSFAGTINVATSSSNAPINLKPNGTGHVAVGNGGASGKLTSNGAFDLVLDTNSGTNSGSITITDGADGEITIDTNGTGDINLTAGADVNIPANIGLTFGDDGEKIEGDGTDLTIASSGALNLTATTDVVVPANVGVTFGTGEKIEGDNTDLTLTSGADINLTATADVNLPNNVGLVFGDDGEKIEGDGTDLTIASSATLNVNTGSSSGNDLKVNTSQLVVEGDTGNVGINTATPGAYKLQVTNGDSSATQETALLYSGKADKKALLVQNGNTTNTATDYLAEFQNGTAGGQTAVAIRANGQIVLGPNGGIDFGTATSGSGSVTGGILSDYEEGTFEATIEGGYTGTGFSENSCTYIKIGNVVHAHFSFTLNNSGSGSSGSAVVIGGLPFNTLSQSTGLRNNNFTGQFNAYLTGTGLGDNAYLYASTKFSSDELVIYHFSGTTIDELKGSELGIRAIVKIDLTYFVSDFT